MKRRIVVAAFWAAACVLGFAFGEWACHSVAFRDTIGLTFGRGHLLTLTHGRGIYDADLASEIEAVRYAKGEEDVDPSDPGLKRAVLARFTATVAVTELAKKETILTPEIDREFEDLRYQFRDGNSFAAALAANRLSQRTLRMEIVANLRTQKWIERQLKKAKKVSDDECAQYFKTHQEEYRLPARFRANHLFLAAPTETPPPIVDLKRRTIDSLAVRLGHGETFSELVALTSEDEATKTRDGDLGFFSAARMPADFFAALGKMQQGEISPPIQTGLGFHIVQMTDSRAMRQMPFEEAKGEIRLFLENLSRKAEVKRLSEGAQFVRCSL
ncbi:MAG: peptidylprolyl isomerase [Verrucomicrobiota bacterium]